MDPKTAETVLRSFTGIVRQHNEYNIYEDVDIFTRRVLRRVKKSYIYDNHQKILRVSCGFDIETTKQDERAFMYHWQFALDKNVLTGRKWCEFEKLIDHLNTWCGWQKCTVIIWVANLGHEFAFMGRRFAWKNIFAIDSHQPIKALTGRCEFRECLTISGKGGLANLAKNFTHTQKAKDDLQYDVPRNSMTELTDIERGYCYCDVEILSEWADYIFTNYPDKGLRIPLTASGIVRSQIQKEAEDTGDIAGIREAINTLFPDKDIYNFVMRYLFRGGYTHACAWWCLVPYSGIIGADFTSSYPAVMLSPECWYPVSPFVETDIECDGQYITDSRLKDRCMWFIADFYGIERTLMHTIESKHKIIDHAGASFDNGRLISANFIRVALTELDYETYLKYYTWTGMRILRGFTAFRGHLPGYMLRPLMRAYKQKARMKAAGLDNTTEYQNYKAIVNSFYGCTVTRLKYAQWKYNQGEPFQLNGQTIGTGDWYEETSAKTYSQLITKQLLSPWWGIYCTAWARKRLLDTVYEIDNGQEMCTVLYCDTDSIYMLDTPRNRQIIEKYNEHIYQVNAIFDPEFFDLGAFDWIGADKKTGEPGHYLFKTLGAKRYVKHKDGVTEVTIAGLPKGSLEKKLVRPFNDTGNCYIAYRDAKHKKGMLGWVDLDELFDTFNDGMLLTCEESMKTRAVYSPDPYEDTIIDLQGNIETMHEESGVAIVDTMFTLNIDDIYAELIEQYAEERRMMI